MVGDFSQNDKNIIELHKMNVRHDVMQDGGQ